MLCFLAVLLQECEEPATPLSPKEALSNPFVRPAIVYTYPPHMSRGPYDDSRLYEIDFNKTMDLESVKRAMSLTTLYGDSNYIDTNRFLGLGNWGSRWQLSGAALFQGLPKIGQFYKLGISSRAQDTNGNHLQPDYYLIFMPEPNFRVKWLNMYTLGYNDIQCFLYLNSPVDSSFFSKIKFSPTINSHWSFYRDIAWYLYFRGDDLRFNTAYTMTIDNSAHDIYGNRLLAPDPATVYIAPFQVKWTIPSDGDTLFFLHNEIRVSCNGSLDTSTVRTSFRIEPPVIGTIAVREETGIIFLPAVDLEPMKTYRIEVLNSLKAHNGAQLPVSVFSTFHTAPFRGWTNNWWESDGDTMFITSSSGLIFLFNGEFDTSTVRHAVRIEPSIDWRAEFPQWGWVDNMTIYPLSPFVVGTTYIVTIDTTFHSISEYPLHNAIIGRYRVYRSLR